MNETHAPTAATAEAPAAPRWKPLSKMDRRVAGVLVEKAKTTPDQYPMTVNGLINGCNQKSNRDPQMQLEESDIMDSLDRLKQAGVVVEIQGSGRVAKFKHLLYEWLGVGKVELAVMTELLLRGAQTEGELRGRASRMEPIADLNALRELLTSLRAKRLVIDLTPPGRGQIISHNLYEPEELERLKQKLSTGEYASSPADSPGHSVAAPSSAAPAYATSPAAAPQRPAAYAASAPAASEKTASELQSVRAELAAMRRELEELAETVRRQENTIADLRSSLGG